MLSNIIKIHGTKYNHNRNLFDNPNNKILLLLPDSRKTVRFSNQLNKTFKLQQIIKGNN
jgi:hypothetical protein